MCQLSHGFHRLPAISIPFALTDCIRGSVVIVPDLSQLPVAKVFDEAFGVGCPDGACWLLLELARAQCKHHRHQHHPVFYCSSSNAPRAPAAPGGEV